MKKGKDMEDKEDVHMDQELNLEEEGMVDEGQKGMHKGSDTRMEKMIHSYPSHRNFHSCEIISQLKSQFDSQHKRVMKEYSKIRLEPMKQESVEIEFESVQQIEISKGRKVN